jgi:hypothetical protein
MFHTHTIIDLFEHAIGRVFFRKNFPLHFQGDEKFSNAIPKTLTLPNFGGISVFEI